MKEQIDTLMDEYKFISKQYSSLMLDEQGNILEDTPTTKKLRDRMYEIVEIVKKLEGYTK